MTILKNLTIIIAEDDYDDAELIRNSFEKHPAFAKVMVVYNGQELIDLLKQPLIPDLVLTDINMPIVNGIDALIQISGFEEMKKIPAFVYSTTINTGDEARCKAIGVRGFIIKPSSIAEFEMIPEKILELLA
jgi:CheY-like chemotaxis protein